MTLLLDTNVVSELLRDPPSAKVLDWFSRQAANTLFVSTITQAEMLLGVRLLPAGRRRRGLDEAMSSLFEVEFAGRLLVFDAPAAAAYADIVATRRKAGRPISSFDAQIAAIARSRSLAVVTRNVADFDRCGVELVNPWQA